MLGRETVEAHQLLSSRSRRTPGRQLSLECAEDDLDRTPRRVQIKDLAAEALRIGPQFGPLQELIADAAVSAALFAPAA